MRNDKHQKDKRDFLPGGNGYILRLIYTTDSGAERWAEDSPLVRMEYRVSYIPCFGCRFYRTMCLIPESSHAGLTIEHRAKLTLQAKRRLTLEGALAYVHNHFATQSILAHKHRHPAVSPAGSLHLAPACALLRP